MGYASRRVIERAGNYLLALLAAEREVDCARFYDGTAATEHALLLGMGYTAEQIENQDDDDGVYVTDCPVAYLDLAVVQLKAERLVEFYPTDGGYGVRLAEAGRMFVAAGQSFEYLDSLLPAGRAFGVCSSKPGLWFLY